jgi:hypothetical protein
VADASKAELNTGLGIVRMARTLKIYLTAPSPDLVHQWRNFGEDIYRALRDECEVSIDEIDASTSEFFVRGIHKHELRTVAATVRKIAEKNLMSQIIGVTEVTDDHAT